ncbi:uncharacterized protein LOC132053972 [Lycium ferocissimum]|uniref:uncharacterized protein LOC132053972 n=1 Tax=Lycium ferocissimum TaxID=112874 RepID=UPI002814CB56|nr:uncharacterized protein LOC132053972 [Lycium ferocissimum]
MAHLFITQFSQVKEELEEVTGALEAFTKCWPAPLHGQHHITVVRDKYLKNLLSLFWGILNGAKEQGNLDGVTKAIGDLHGAFSALSETIDIRFIQHLTVTPRIVAKVASSITGVPRNFFPAPFHLPVELLVQRLSRKLVGLDNQLRAIINAISMHKLGSRPLYSFLLLGPPDHRKTALAVAQKKCLIIGKEMFDNRIVEYNVAGFTEDDFTVEVFSCPFLVVNESDGASDSMVRLISSCVLVFDNVDKANTALFDFILRILEIGSYVDASGRQIVFSNTLILFTSRVEFPRCRCARVVWETSFKHPFKELLKSVGEVQQPRCDCSFHECLTDVRFSAEKQFKPRFFDSLGDVILIPWLSLSQFMSVFRIQVRDAASYSKKKWLSTRLPPCFVIFGGISMTRCKRYIRLITCQKVSKFVVEGLVTREGGHVVKHFVEELVSKLSNVDSQSIVYIDELLPMTLRRSKYPWESRGSSTSSKKNMLSRYTN